MSKCRTLVGPVIMCPTGSPKMRARLVLYVAMQGRVSVMAMVLWLTDMVRTPRCRVKVQDTSGATVVMPTPSGLTCKQGRLVRRDSYRARSLRLRRPFGWSRLLRRRSVTNLSGRNRMSAVPCCCVPRVSLVELRPTKFRVISLCSKLPRLS